MINTQIRATERPNGCVPKMIFSSNYTHNLRHEGDANGAIPGHCVNHFVFSVHDFVVVCWLCSHSRSHFHTKAMRLQGTNFIFE